MDANSTEVVQKVQALVRVKFGGDYSKAFAAYDLDHNGKLGPRDISGLLKDAGIGNWLTRGAWVSGIISELDANGDGAVSIQELALAMAKDALL